MGSTGMGHDPNVGAVRVVLASLAAVLVAGMVVVGDASAAHACSCIAERPAQQAAEADAVFAGELISVTPARVDDSGLYQHAFRFDVDEVFVGPVGPTAEVLSSLGGAACGIEPAIGQRWVVVASRDERHPEDLTTNGCTASRVIGPTTPRFVGQGRPPDPAVAVPPDRTVDTRAVAGQLGAIGLLAIGLVAGAMALGRRRTVLA